MLIMDLRKKKLLMYYEEMRREDGYKEWQGGGALSSSLDLSKSERLRNGAI